MKVTVLSFFKVRASSVFLAVMFSTATVSAVQPQGAAASDLLNHPRYSKYEFERREGVVNLGTRPLHIPAGLISEAIKRDVILREQLSELGIEIRFYAFLKGDDVNFFLKRGDLSAGIAGDMPTLTAAATTDIKITNIVQLGFTSVVASEFTLMEGLRGKRIGYAFGSNAHFALLQALSGVGLKEDDVRLVPMGVDAMPEALDAGKIDAFSAWEPVPAMALKKDSDFVIIHRNLNEGFLYFSGSLSVEQPEAVHYIASAVIRAILWMQSDKKNLLKASSWCKQASEELMGKAMDVSAEELAELARKDIVGVRHPFRIPKHNIIKGGTLHREFEFLKGLNNIPKTADWNRVGESFDMSVVEDILSSPRKYRINEYDYTEGIDNND
jgi:ABC-type nitrate/sulfonate/bicarbonate transport system substrate-binding protein